MKTKCLLFLLALCCTFTSFAQEDSLSKYISRIKKAYELRTAETSMGTVGYEMIYGIESFEAKRYDYASWNFATATRMDAAHPYAHYLLGLSLLAQGKDAEGKAALDKAIGLLPPLKDRLAADIALHAKKPEPKIAVKSPEKKAAAPVATKPVKQPAKPAEKIGGPLFFGSYACDYMQYQGAGAAVAYKAVPKGSFKINKDGTYRWLDNGTTGKYKYDAKTGKITWLTGFFASSKPVSTIFRPGEKVASIRIEMRENYTWGCGCNK